MLPAMQRIGPVTAWVVDETGFVKKGSHSVGVARQYCGQVEKGELPGGGEFVDRQRNRQPADCLAIVYCPKSGPMTLERCREADIPQEVQFQTKPQIALRQIRQAVEDGVAPGVVLADKYVRIESRVPGRSSGTEAGLLAGGAQQHDGVGAGTTAVAPQALEGKRSKAHTDAAGPDAPADYREGTGRGAAGESLA